MHTRVHHYKSGPSLVCLAEVTFKVNELDGEGIRGRCVLDVCNVILMAPTVAQLRLMRDASVAHLALTL